MKRVICSFALLLTASLVASCSLEKTETPPLSGPSELGLSLKVEANPDVITQDGFSQSLVTIEAKDSNNRPVPNLALRAEITVGGVAADFGQLSARTIVTGSDGKALLTYTAPPAGPEPVDAFTVVTLLVTPIGNDFANAVSRQVSIRLTPRGVILPPNSTPVPRFTFSPTAPAAFATVTFDASSSTDDGTITSFDWQFGDGSTGTGVRPQHQFRSAGTFQVTLTVTDDRNLSASTTQTVTVTAASAPTADFTFSPTRPAPLQTVFFNAAASKAGSGRTLVTFAWDFGNGRTGSGINASTTFSAPGTFSVSLTVTDDVGQTASVSKPVVVEEGVPGAVTASFTFSPTDPVAGITRVFFNGTASQSASGIASYEWDLGDGTTATGSTTDHVFQRAGSFSVRLTVRDNNGATASATRTVTVTAAGAPTADFSFSPTRPAPRQTVTFNGSASTAATGRTIVSYSWDLGNGQLKTGQIVTTSYDNAGTFNVTLTVTDDGGRTATATKSITVEGTSGGITPSFTFSPTNPIANVTDVFFNASASTAPAGIASYQWDFGDGSTGTGVTTNHRYTAAGNFSVRLTVRDNNGLTASTTQTVTVTASSAPTADFAFSPSSPAPNQTVTFNASASTAASGRTLVSYAWDFGDGCRTGSEGTSSCPTGSTTGVRTTHVYTSPGTFNVTLTVTDDVGLKATKTTSLTVTAPVANFSFSPTDPSTTTKVFFNASSSTAAAGIKSYAWDFGDGCNPVSEGSDPGFCPTGSTNGVQTNHTFSKGARTYVVRLTIVDNAGNTATTTKDVTVK